MYKSALKLMAPTTIWIQPTLEEIAHYIDPHVYWHGGETITYGEPGNALKSSISKIEEDRKWQDD